MKITRRQLRNIIKEATTSSGTSRGGSLQRDKEAVYSIIYVAEYIRVYREILYLSIFKMLKQSGKPRLDTNFKAINALEDLEGSFKRAIMAWPSTFDAIVEDSQNDGIEKEAEDAAKFDFQESAYAGIEEVDLLINQQTPIGVSAIDAMRKIGHSGSDIAVITRTVPFLKSLMDDDQTLAVFDEIDSHPTMRQTNW